MAEALPPLPEPSAETRHAHECLQRALLASGGRYAIPNPYPDGWRIAPVGVDVTVGEPPESRLWLLVPWDPGQGEPPLAGCRRLIDSLSPDKRAQITLALSVGVLPPVEILDAVERGLDVDVVACTSKASAAGPKAQANGSQARIEALLAIDNAALSAVDPAQAWHAMAQVVEEVGFFQLLNQVTPRVWVTPTLVALCVGVWLIQILTGISPMNPGALELQQWGGSAAMVTVTEPWRLLTAGFLHGGALHLGINMWVLRDVGPICERLFGNLTFLAVYLIAVVGGFLASMGWHPEIVAAVGASGGIFGLGGAILGFILARRQTVPVSVFLRFRRSLGVFVVFNLIFGFVINSAPVGINVDNAGHVGGLVAGFVGGFLLSRPLPPGPEAWKRLLWIPLLIAGLGGGFAALRGSEEIRAVSEERRAELAAAAQLDTLLTRIDEEWAALLAGVDAGQAEEAVGRFQAQAAETTREIEAIDLPPRLKQVGPALVHLLDVRREVSLAWLSDSPQNDALDAALEAATDGVRQALEGD